MPELCSGAGRRRMNSNRSGRNNDLSVHSELWYEDCINSYYYSDIYNFKQKICIYDVFLLNLRPQQELNYIILTRNGHEIDS